MKKYVLEITVFLSGAVVMMLELTGSRILAPFVGTSTFVWTSLIGVILASLSLGYYRGGMKADQDPGQKRLSHILLLAGVCIGVVALLNQTVLSFVSSYFVSVKWSAAVSASVLFGVPAYLLGMVSPQAVRIRMKDINTSGATIGRLYALSSLGSIVGTFLVGFYLMAWVGSRNIMFILSGLTLVLSLMNRWSNDSALALIVFLISPFVQAFGKSDLLNVRDTEYGAVQIITAPYPEKTDRVCKVLKVGNEYSSGMYLNSDSLAFAYYPYYKLMFHFHPHPQNTLLIGGGAYSIPKYFQKAYPQMKMDVLEIDPALTQIAREEFRLVTDERITPIHEDGRIYLNRNQKKYDVIMGDAFRSLFSIPFHLTSQEAMEQVSHSLTDEGVLLINLLSPVSGPNRELFHSMVKTCRKVFPQVKAFKPRINTSPEKVQSIMLVCMKQNPGFKAPAISAEIQHLLSQEINLKDVGVEEGIVLTDDFAPVEHYADNMLNAYFQK